MFDHLKHWLIPHAGNEYKPLLLRVEAILALAIVAVFLFFGASYFERAIRSGNLAAVISAVLVDLTNTDRAENGLGTLTTNETLVLAAQLKANDMAAKSYFAHTSPEGLNPWHWFNQAEYKFQYAGENLAVYFSDSADVERAWMNSPSHRANILNGHFTEIGIATAEGTYQGRPTVFVVQMFGSPAVEKPKPAPIAAATVGESSPTIMPPTTVSTSSPVAGTSTAAEESSLRTIISDDTFIAVKSDSHVASTADAAVITPTPSMWDRLMVSPKTVLHALYLILALVLGFALALAIGIELKKQHIPTIVLPVVLIVLLAALVYINYAFVLGGGVLVL